VRQVENSADNVFYVRDHWIVERIGVFGDLEIFLDETPHVGEEGPMGADSTAIFIRLGDVVGTDRDEPTIGNLELTMEFDKPFSLPAVLGGETSALDPGTMSDRIRNPQRLDAWRC